MSLPIDIGSPLPEPPRSVRSLANTLAEDLEYSYRMAREVTVFKHKRAESRYNERVVEKIYAPGVLVRVIQHTHPGGVPSKLAQRYSGLCEVVQVCGPVLTLRELDTMRVFTANHDAVRRSTLELNRVQPICEGPHPPPIPRSDQNTAQQSLKDQLTPISASPTPMIIDNQTLQPFIESVRKKTRLFNSITNVGCSNLSSSNSLFDSKHRVPDEEDGTIGILSTSRQSVHIYISGTTDWLLLYIFI